MKNCDDIINEFLTLDKGERLPFKLSIHIIFCKKCRDLVRAMTKAEKLAAQPLNIPSPINSNSITKAIQNVDPSYNPKEFHVSFSQWIITGLFLIACIILYSFITRNSIPEILNFYTWILFAGALSIYCIFFVINNMDFFIKKIGFKFPLN